MIFAIGKKKKSSAIVAIIWKPLSSDRRAHSERIAEIQLDRSDRSVSENNTKMQNVRHPFQDGCHHEYREVIVFGTFYGRSAKIRLPLSNWRKI